MMYKICRTKFKSYRIKAIMEEELKKFIRP